MKKKIVSSALILALGVSTCVNVGGVDAAKKPALSKKKLSMKAGATKVIKLKNVKKAKVTWKSSKKSVVKAKKKGKFACQLTAVKKGKATITCVAKIGKKTKKLKCKVTVSAKTKANTNNNTSTAAPNADASSTPAATADASKAPDASGTPAASADVSKAPVASADVTTAPSAAPATAKPTGPVETKVPYKAQGFDENGLASFENGTAGFNGRGGDVQVSVADGGKEGKCLYVTGRTNAWHGASINVTDSVVPGATYKVSGWIKQTSGSAAQVKLSADFNNSTYPEIASAQGVASGEWKFLEGEIVIPEEGGNVSFYFEIPGNETCDFYVDNVSIVMTKTAAPDAEDSVPSLMETMKLLCPNVGTCANFDGWRAGKQLQTTKTLNFIKKHYNSITLEDEMKPSGVLGGYQSSTISVDEARAQGYYIPENYTENVVPKFNFGAIDNVLKICYDNGLRMRGHTFVWHQQTPTWFFCKNYRGANPVEPEVMDARAELYIRTVMKHVMDKEKEITGSVGTIVYAWDIVNEYLHHDHDASRPSWVDVYGEQGVECTYVRNAFKYAYAELEEYGVANDVTLFYNDYDTYEEVDDLVALVKFINAEKQICGGIGMQSHVDVDKPSAEKYGIALEAFINTGLQVQITELDIGTKNVSEDDQCKYVKDLMNVIIDKQLNRDTTKTKGITGFTIWGLYDSVSWKGDANPLFFTSLKDPKPMYYALLEAVNERLKK